MERGFRILPSQRHVPDHLVEQFRGAATPHLSDVMQRLFAMDAAIRPYHPHPWMVGHALTVHTRPGDNLIIHKALNMVQPGDVLVIDGSGDTTQALIGEIMTRQAEKKGAAGYVIDGAVRDSGILPTLGIPVYARGVTHRGPYKDGPGEINVPISCGGCMVRPGDLIVGDHDGVVVVPYDEVEVILGKMLKKRAQEEQTLREIEEDRLDRSWVDQALLAKGYRLD